MYNNEVNERRTLKVVSLSPLVSEKSVWKGNEIVPQLLSLPLATRRLYVDELSERSVDSEVCCCGRGIMYFSLVKSPPSDREKMPNDYLKRHWICRKVMVVC